MVEPECEASLTQWKEQRCHPTQKGRGHCEGGASECRWAVTLVTSTARGHLFPVKGACYKGSVLLVIPSFLATFLELAITSNVQLLRQQGHSGQSEPKSLTFDDACC